MINGRVHPFDHCAASSRPRSPRGASSSGWANLCAPTAPEAPSRQTASSLTTSWWVGLVTLVGLVTNYVLAAWWVGSVSAPNSAACTAYFTLLIRWSAHPQALAEVLGVPYGQLQWYVIGTQPGGGRSGRVGARLAGCTRGGARGGPPAAQGGPPGARGGGSGGGGRSGRVGARLAGCTRGQGGGGQPAVRGGPPAAPGGGICGPGPTGMGGGGPGPGPTGGSGPAALRWVASRCSRA